MPACQTLAPTHLETPFAVPTRLDGAPYKADKVTVKRKSGYQEKKQLSRQKVAVKAKSGCQGKRWLSREKESVKRIFGIRDAWELPEGRVRRPPRNTRAAGRRRQGVRRGVAEEPGAVGAITGESLRNVRSRTLAPAPRLARARR